MEVSHICTRNASASMQSLQRKCITYPRSAANTAYRPFSQASCCHRVVAGRRMLLSAVKSTLYRLASPAGSSLYGAAWPRTGVPKAGRRKVTTTAFLGVGAPEAVLVGVVALIVFGPKGLAEAVKGLGSTLKAFQPTIREIVSVSSDLKNSLEEQIGLDDIRSELRNSVTPEPRPVPPAQQAEKASSEERPSSTTAGELAAEMDADLDRKRAVASAAAWGGQPPVQPVAKEETSHYDGDSDKAPASSAKPALNNLSMAELEAELARRKAAEKPAETQ